MALLSFKIVLLLLIKIIIINEVVCFPLNFLENNIFSGGLDYVSKQFNSIQPRFNLRKLLTPETPKMYVPETPKDHAGRYSDIQKLPAVNSTKTNSAELIYDLSTENSNGDYNNDDTQNSKIENKDVDEKWNSFFDEYFKKLLSKPQSNLMTTENINIKETENMISPTDKNTDNFNNDETSQTDIFDDKNIETTNESFTDTTDTTPLDYETTTGDDDLLRNGVSGELLASLLG